MKTLDTLIEDIHESLVPLTEGKHYNITDEQIVKFGEDIKSALKHWAHPTPRNSEFTIRMSNVGKPLRQTWYDSTKWNTSKI